MDNQDDLNDFYDECLYKKLTDKNGILERETIKAIVTSQCTGGGWMITKKQKTESNGFGFFGNQANKNYNNNADYQCCHIMFRNCIC